jgi:hypothetical protein
MNCGNNYDTIQRQDIIIIIIYGLGSDGTDKYIKGTSTA